VYDSAHPKVKRFAAKWFVMDDERHEITLYYADRIEHWQTDKKDPRSWKAFTLRTTDTNPYGVIPVFELQSPGEFVKVTTIQDAINKLFSDMMVAAEFGAAPMRWAISQADPGDIKNGPNVWAWFPAGDGTGQQASVGQFEATQLTNFHDSMDKLANYMAIITRTPKHYLLQFGSNISGEALMTMEAPLTKKVETRQRVFGAVWQEVASFLLKMEGMEVKPADITVIWTRPETVQVYTEAQARQLAVNTGIPLITVLRREGWSDVEIERMQKDQELQDKAKKTVAQAVLKDLKLRQEQNAFNQQEQAVAQAGGSVNA
ncbi:MAG: phage portal protein, partial [Bryobacterales bacterium]|nr:phage portal protein [Bryobacterales bacterium]